MQVEEFYRHLCDELKLNRALFPYYKLVDGTAARQLFRKAYFVQRLDYIDRHVNVENSPVIWDCGCGYGTTGLFFAMKGQPVIGSTLEYYVDEWNHRCEFWNQFGDTSLMSYRYDNLFDMNMEKGSVDYLILQDTLHHIEPLDSALSIFYDVLKPNGKIILVEENGACLLKRMILFAQRGNKRVISYYDETLKKEILMGNENLRSEKLWKKHFENAGFFVEDSSVEYVRFLPSFCFNADNFDKNLEKERKIMQLSEFLKKYAFFGMNMVVSKK